MAKAKKNIDYKVRVVYGFEKKLKIVLLGEVVSGTIDDGMFIQVSFKNGAIVGTWEILEVLHTSFINDVESPNFKGLIVKCKTLIDFELLRSLRVYDETISIIEKPQD